jgi:uridylate kinase
VLEFGLNVMDTTAFTMCQENDMPIIVFDINNEENLLRILKGEQIGTVVEKL